MSFLPKMSFAEVVNADRRTIACVIPSLQAGGMERVMSVLLREFVRPGFFEIHLVLYGRYPGVFFDVPQSVTVHRPSFDFDRQPRLISAIRRCFYLRRILTKLKPHAVISLGEYWNSFLLFSLLGKRQNVFVSDRCQPSQSLGRIHDQLRR